MALLMALRSGWEARHLVPGRVREGAEYARDVASRAMERGRHLAEAATAKDRGAVEGVTREGGENAVSRDYVSAAGYRGL